MDIIDLVVVTLGLLGLGVFATGLFRSLPVPYSVVLVLVGVLLKTLAPHFDLLDPIEHFRVDPDLVLFIFLPILIFESALTMNVRQLLINIMPILALAILGVLLSAVAVAFILTYTIHIPFMLAMVFGIIIAGTDPVGVVELFRSIGAPQRLTTLIEGESMFNDATSIVMFTVFFTMLLAGTNLTAETSIEAMFEFLEVFIGGIVVGLVTGAVVSWLINMLRSNLSEILVLTLMVAYSSFVVTEHYLHFSGVMAVTGCALMMAVFVVPRLNLDDSESLTNTWEFLGSICNTLLFLLMGLTINLQSLMGSSLIILLSFVAVLVARALSIYSLLPAVSKIFRLPTFSLNERHMLWWGGLRGGLAIAMVLSIPETVPGQALLLDLTLGVVLATFLINAPTIEPLMKKLKLDKPSEFECVEISHTQLHAEHCAQHTLAELTESGVLTKAGFATTDEKIIETFRHPHQHVGIKDERINLSLTLLQQENIILKSIFESGVIPQYTFLEIGDELQVRRESVIKGKEISSIDLEKTPNFFERAEGFIIGHLREKDWATQFLSWYQNIRHADHLIRICILLQMTLAAKNFLKDLDDVQESVKEEKLELIERDIIFYRNVLVSTREAYPEFYRRFMRNFAYRSTVAVALRSVEKSFKQGIVGAKSYREVSSKIYEHLKALPKITEPVEDLDTRALIKLVPLYSDLPQEALEAIANAAKPVKFLPGDTVIEQGKKGDSLYIIVKGGLRVIKTDLQGKQTLLADLYSGDFVGEMALLGDSVRLASVKAILPTTLLRITRDDILAIAKHFPALKQALENAKQARSE